MFCRPDPGWTTQAEEMASLEVKMTDIMDRMTRMEAEMIAKDKMVEVRDQKIALLEGAVETNDRRIVLLNFLNLSNFRLSLVKPTPSVLYGNRLSTSSIKFPNQLY